MQISDLEMCVQLAEKLNFSRAAEACFITQPVLSKHVSAVEREIGARLFQRDHRSVSLTCAGVEFVKGAKACLAEYGRMLESVQLAKGGLQALVKIACPQGLFRDYLPDIVSRFIDSHPHIRIEIEGMSIPELVDAIPQRTHDVFIIPENTFSFHTLRSVAFLEYDYGVLVAPDGPLSDKRSISIRDLRDVTVKLQSSRILGGLEDTIFKYLDPGESGAVIEQDVGDRLDDWFFSLSGADCVGLASAGTRGYLEPDLKFIPFNTNEDVPKMRMVVAWDESRKTQGLAAFLRSFLELTKKQN